MRDLTTLAVLDAAQLLENKEISAVELAQAHLDSIAAHDSAIGAYREVYDDVIAQARSADERRARGDHGTWLGIPIALKDNIVLKGKRASAGSKILDGYVAPYDATVTAALRDAGVVFLGRTNQDEFAMGSSGENSAFTITKNPHDLLRVPGGSSSGSAAAVAGHMALAALGTETGGSVRQPAAFCGIVGLKPTYGAVSRHGMMPMAASLNQVGSFSKTVADGEALFEVISREDTHYDANSVPVAQRTAANTTSSKKIGVPRHFLGEGVDSDVLANFNTTVERLQKSGYEVVDIELPNIHYSMPVYYVLVPAEISTDLARFDGMRYGLSKVAGSLLGVYEQSRALGFGREPRRRILLGTYVLSAGYHDAYYNKACTVRELIKADFVRAFHDVAAIVMPTTPSPAFKIGEKADDPLAMYLADIFTVSANLACIPSISVPSGTVERDGVALPVGFQIMGPWFGEKTLFSIGRAVTGEA